MLLYILSMSCFIIDQLVHSLFQTFQSYLKKRRWKTKGLLSIEGNCSAKYFTYYQEGRKEIGSKKNNGSNVQFNTIRQDMENQKQNQRKLAIIAFIQDITMTDHNMWWVGSHKHTHTNKQLKQSYQRSVKMCSPCSLVVCKS